MKPILFLIFFVGVILLASCGRTPDQAKNQLATMGIPFNSKYFVEKAGTGELKTVKLFVEGGINIDVKAFPEGETEELSAIELAVKRNKKDVVVFLIDKGADVVNSDALFYAKSTGKNELTQILEKAGCKIDSKRYVAKVMDKQPPQMRDTNLSDNNSEYPGKYPQGSLRYLQRSDLAGLSKYELKIYRNEIYARHGYIFKSDDMVKYFFNLKWYKPTYADVTKMLSSIELRNIELIKSLEK